MHIKKSHTWHYLDLDSLTRSLLEDFGFWKFGIWKYIQIFKWICWVHVVVRTPTSFRYKTHSGYLVWHQRRRALRSCVKKRHIYLQHYLFQKVHTFTSTMRALAAASHSQPNAPDPGLSLRLQIFVHSTYRLLLLSFFLWLWLVWLAAAGCKLAGCLCSSFCSSCFDPCQCLCRLPSLNCVLFLKVFWLTGSWEIMIGKGNTERNT